MIIMLPLFSVQNLRMGLGKIDYMILHYVSTSLQPSYITSIKHNSYLLLKMTESLDCTSTRGQNARDYKYYKCASS